LWSDAVGLSGRADAVEVEPDGSVVPVEYKAGTRHGRAADLQVCAQALCLEEMLGITVPRGAVWYAASRRKNTVAIDDVLRSTTLAVVASIRDALRSGQLSAAPNDERCTSCQLLHHCLPEVVSRGVERANVEAYLYSCDT